MISSDLKEINLLEATRLFWWDVMNSQLHHQTLLSTLSPDCRLQNAFGNDTRGVNGKEKCIIKIKEIRNWLLYAGLDCTVQHLKQTSSTQTRFVLQGNISGLPNVTNSTIHSVIIGIAIEWQCGVIVGIVIHRNTSVEQFIKRLDDISDDCLSLHSISLKSENGDTDDNIGDSFDEMSPVKRTSDEFNQWASVCLGHTLCPPYIVERPSFSNPVLAVTVLRCENLKSRLRRVIRRPVNACVSVTVGDTTLRTDVVRNNRHPVFSTRTSRPFILRIPEEILHSGCLEITVEDVHLDTVVLARARVPFAHLPCVDKSMDTHEMTLPLELYKPYILSPSEEDGESIANASELVVSRQCSLDSSTSSATTTTTSSGEASITLNIAKVDVVQCWVMRELAARDEQREMRLRAIESDSLWNIGSPTLSVASSNVSSDRLDDGMSDEDKLRHLSVRWVTNNELW